MLNRGSFKTKLSVDTHAMKGLIKTLNALETSDEIRLNFAEKLGITEKFLKNHNTRDFKFSKEDFKNFISNNKSKYEEKINSFQDKIRKDSTARTGISK